MPKFGVYPVADAEDPGDEISSTYGGRHVTVLESDLIHPAHSGGIVNKGDPVVFGTTGLEAVGVAFGGEDDTVAGDLIAVDTEGIWNLDVVADDDDGGSAVAGGDVIYINKTDGVLSKISAPATQIKFGYALGIITSGNTEAIAVKVHWDPLVATVLEVRGTPGDGIVFASVGKEGNPLVYAAASDKAMEVWAKFTFPTTGGFYGIESDVSYEPASSGYGTPVGIVGRTTLAAGKTFTGGQAGMEGVRGHIEFGNTSVLDQASSIFCGLRGVITKSGTPVFTDFDTVACLYCDNLCATDLAGIASTYGSALISLQNHGGTLDAGVIIRGGNKLSAIFKFVTCGGVINTGAKTGGAARNITVNIDGTDWFWNVYES